VADLDTKEEMMSVWHAATETTQDRQVRDEADVTLLQEEETRPREIEGLEITPGHELLPDAETHPWTATKEVEETAGVPATNAEQAATKLQIWSLHKHN
jgi:hypothetical protein